MWGELNLSITSVFHGITQVRSGTQGSAEPVRILSRLHQTGWCQYTNPHAHFLLLNHPLSTNTFCVEPGSPKGWGTAEKGHPQKVHFKHLNPSVSRQEPCSRCLLSQELLSQLIFWWESLPACWMLREFCGTFSESKWLIHHCQWCRADSRNYVCSKLEPIEAREEASLNSGHQSA